MEFEVMGVRLKWNEEKAVLLNLEENLEVEQWKL